ncbi:Eukaryotic translation initiation factor 3 subunit M [Pleurostoma richardsiae]|uniref:Eukaryotic translation initiation factor 3 subunit M n=1 Tax=Pleurostoma richardsiae TaxID=41990 RepID=A0AA38RH42_9PEZI|nr:Eukaryotic translation initiation factor 3 subunit M [Pleurostoma richardsiae]
MASQAITRTESPYKLKFTNGLPPGTDSYEQFELNPRYPRPAPPLKRPTPPWPPKDERKGKWLDKYFDQLDPETEYDQIIRTAVMFGASDFSTALGYAAVFIILTQTPSGAVAVHGGKVIRRGHQRYYETQLYNLHWAYHGSTDPETVKYVGQINKIHAGVWKRSPGTISAPWEAQMAIIALSYFETWVRKVAGAKRQEIHPHVQAAWPAWGERLTGHFVSEPSDGSRSLGINYPRDWQELERFFFWFDEFPIEEQMTPEQLQKGHETAEAFIDQFCELWFPRPLYYFGRHFLLTFLPPNSRRRQRIGEPNPLLAALFKWFLRTALNLGDFFSDDPAEPPMVAFREMLLTSDLAIIDKDTKRQRDWQDRALVLLLSVVLVGLAVGCYRYVRI